MVGGYLSKYTSVSMIYVVCSSAEKEAYTVFISESASKNSEPSFSTGKLPSFPFRFTWIWAGLVVLYRSSICPLPYPTTAPTGVYRYYFVKSIFRMVFADHIPFIIVFMVNSTESASFGKTICIVLVSFSSSASKRTSSPHEAVT